MASEPSRFSEVGNRMSRATTSVMVTGIMFFLSLERLAGEDPQPRLFLIAGTPPGARPCGSELEACLAQHPQVGLPVVVAPPHGGATPCPIALFSLPFTDG